MTAPVPGARVLRPQAGPQELYLSTPADIALYGGAAGGGKTYGLLLEALRHTHNPRYAGVIFRRTNPQILNEGGLWDTSMEIYPYVGGRPVAGRTEWRFPSGATVRFTHMEHEDNRLDWSGAQVPFFGWDELITFTAKQFWYMTSRGRSSAGIRSYMRATCNPDADSWVAELVNWWIDQETGYPRPERSGVIRWYLRRGDDMHWADARAELVRRFSGSRPKSFTFIASSLEDNPILMAGNPDYLATLEAMHHIERERLLKGNWKIRAEAGKVFNRAAAEILATAPAGAVRIVRQWDKASSAKGGDWTVGLKLAYYPDGTYVILDVIRVQLLPGTRDKLIRNTAQQDGVGVTVGLFQDPAAAGVTDLHATVALLAGFPITHTTVSGNKVTMAGPVAAQWEVGNVKLVRAPWNEALLRELHSFPTPAVPDDQVDGLSGSFNAIQRLRAQGTFHVSQRG